MKHEHTRIMLGVFVALFAIFVIWALVRGEKEVFVPKIQRAEFCQPFQGKEVQDANTYYLQKGGYRVVLASDLHLAFREQSAGKLELLEQTMLRCYTHLGDAGYAVNQYWARATQPNVVWK